MFMKSHVSVQGRFQLSVHKAATDAVVAQSAEFTNVVLNQGLDIMGRQTYLYGVAVGTGNSTPTELQTDLDNRVASTTTLQAPRTVTYVPNASDVHKYTLTATYRFDAGVFNNVTLAEIGITTAEGNPNKLWNRALIKDALGEPTTITVLSDEYLDVKVQVDYHIPIVDVTQTINLVDNTGAPINSITCTIRPANTGDSYYPPIGTYTGTDYVYERIRLIRAINNCAQVFTGDIGVYTASPSGSALASTNWGSSDPVQAIQNTYVDGTYKLTGAMFIKLNAGNGTIKSLRVVTTLHAYQVQFDPPITKNNTQTLRIPIEISWGRYTTPSP